MPFHDTGVCLEGDVALDISHHFVHFWNNTMLEKHGKTYERISSITTKAKYEGLFRTAFRKLRPSSTTGVV